MQILPQNPDVVALRDTGLSLVLNRTRVSGATKRKLEEILRNLDSAEETESVHGPEAAG